MVLEWREMSFSVYLVVYCVAVWYLIRESGELVCSWWCILYLCGIVLQRVDC
jgi:hypothetical protein